MTEAEIDDLLADIDGAMVSPDKPSGGLAAAALDSDDDSPRGAADARWRSEGKSDWGSKTGGAGGATSDAPAARGSRGGGYGTSSGAAGDDDDLEALLAMTTTATKEAPLPEAPAPASIGDSGLATAGTGRRAKCSTVFIGGADADSGIARPGRQRACDSLRCTQCDFRIVAFTDSEWDDAADYMFFRNNVPDRDKLAPMLRRRPGSVARCCQCAWHNAARREMAVARSCGVHWVCAGHAER